MNDDKLWDFLQKNPKINSTELKKSGLSRRAIYHYIRKFEKEGKIKRVVDIKDTRRYIVVVV